jgi:hypothetical protein
MRSRVEGVRRFCAIRACGGSGFDSGGPGRPGSRQRRLEVIDKKRSPFNGASRRLICDLAGSREMGTNQPAIARGAPSMTGGRTFERGVSGGEREGASPLLAHG